MHNIPKGMTVRLSEDICHTRLPLSPFLESDPIPLKRSTRQMFK